MIGRIAFLAVFLSGCQGAGIVVGSALQGMSEASKQQPAQQMSAPATHTCYAAGESVDGMNKICFYDCATGRAAATVSAASMCPTTIQQ
ncbi:hypothetical protein [Mesorhizobium sp. B2-6-1]|uniref:hypothetical protein n=1 Tax=Mesorhizobium sp. B2-6-1 TaxID=2589916 RepID=UPI00112901E7|nr:hypothetical protein [Mesorhizobium sp. B2-6-1]TPJ59957.1 hypothetical protein FJ443_22455 [Mesorhizobium sp. B2-6-1]